MKTTNSEFFALCSVAATTSDIESARKLESLLRETPQGKEIIESMQMYNEGRITLAELTQKLAVQIL